MKQHARIKYCCKTCECAPKIADVPNKVIDKGLADAGLLAEIAVQKFGDHLPLYRQEQIFARDGVHIPRSTQCAWMGVVAELLAPVVEGMKSDLLKSKKLHTDDTVIRVQDPGAHKAKIARLWVYVGDKAIRTPVFDYTRSRSREGPANFLEKFSGYLQADAFSGYDCIYASKAVIEVACWAHARRKFFDARESDARADEMLLLIAEMYAVEKEIRDFSPNLRRDVRQLKTAPVLKRIDAWLEIHEREALPKSDLGQAVRYARNQWIALTRFIEDGILEAGRVENWRGGRSLGGVAVSDCFRLCIGASFPGMAPFPVPARRTGRAALLHPALIQNFMPSRSAAPRESQAA